MTRLKTRKSLSENPGRLLSHTGGFSLGQPVISSKGISAWVDVADIKIAKEDVFKDIKI